jgi:hypothetical protein
VPCRLPAQQRFASLSNYVACVDAALDDRLHPNSRIADDMPFRQEKSYFYYNRQARCMVYEREEARDGMKRQKQEIRKWDLQTERKRKERIVGELEL